MEQTINVLFVVNKDILRKIVKKTNLGKQKVMVVKIYGGVNIVKKNLQTNKNVNITKNIVIIVIQNIINMKVKAKKNMKVMMVVVLDVVEKGTLHHLVMRQEI
jgi:hypothetical protein